MNHTRQGHAGRLGRLCAALAALSSLAAMPAAAGAAPAQAAVSRPSATPQAPQAAAPQPLLKGIVLLAAPGQLVEDGWPGTIQEVDASRLPDLAGADVRADLRGLLGKPITMPLMEDIRTAIGKRLLAMHRPYAAISFPRQQVRDGVLQVLVIESRLGKVQVEGAHYFSPRQYREALRMKSGDPLDTQTLSAAANAINGNKFRQAALVNSPGEEVGTTDLTIRAKDRLPLEFNFGFNNTGNNATNMYRLNAGVDWGNAFWRGDDLNYQFSASPDLHKLQQHSLTYTTTMPWGDILSLMGSYATNYNDAQGLVSSSGKNINASARYAHALPPMGSANGRLTFGYDYKSTNNNVLFGGMTVFPTTTEIDQFLASIDAGMPDRYGSTRIGLTLVGSPGNMTGRNTDAAFASQQAGASAHYAYARLQLERVTTLPARLNWHSLVTAQVSSGNLLPSEQLVFAGRQSVRGFVEQSATRDEGVTWQNELRAPELGKSLGKLLGLGERAGTFTPYLFLDAGVGNNHTRLDGAPSSRVSVISAGPAMSWQLSSRLTVNVSWGFPLLREGNVGQRLGPEFDIQAVF